MLSTAQRRRRRIRHGQVRMRRTICLLCDLGLLAVRWQHGIRRKSVLPHLQKFAASSVERTRVAGPAERYDSTHDLQVRFLMYAHPGDFFEAADQG